MDNGYCVWYKMEWRGICMIKNIERVNTPDLDLYNITFGNDAPAQKKLPELSIKFENDDSLFEFFKNHIAFIPDEEKTKITVDFNNVENVELLEKRLIELAEECELNKNEDGRADAIN